MRLTVSTAFQGSAASQPTLSASESTRVLIHDALIRDGYAPKSGMIAEFSDGLFNKMLEYYNQHYFGLDFLVKFAEKDKPLLLRWNTKSTSTAGWCKVTENLTLVEVSKLVVLQLFRAGEKHHSVNGLHCSDSLYCVQVIFEHELTHAYMSVILGKPQEGHGPSFTQFVLEHFGHTANTHSLFSGDSEKKVDVTVAREKVAAYVKKHLREGHIATVHFSDGVQKRVRILSVRGTKNIQAEVIDASGQGTGRGFFAKNPIPYWTVCQIDNDYVPGYKDVFGEKSETKITKDLTVEEKSLLIRKKLRETKRLGIGAMIRFMDGEIKRTGTVTSTRGSKNATVNMTMKEFRVPYELIIEIEGASIHA